jgi:hypothetical protein
LDRRLIASLAQFPKSAGGGIRLQLYGYFLVVLCLTAFFEMASLSDISMQLILRFFKNGDFSNLIFDLKNVQRNILKL